MSMPMWIKRQTLPVAPQPPATVAEIAEPPAPVEEPSVAEIAEEPDTNPPIGTFPTEGSEHQDECVQTANVTDTATIDGNPGQDAQTVDTLEPSASSASSPEGFVAVGGFATALDEYEKKAAAQSPAVAGKSQKKSPRKGKKSGK